MFRFFRNTALTLGLLLAPSIVAAQLGSVPHTFTAGTTISSSDVNANFSTAYSIALNRTGGVMTGSLTTLAIIPNADALYDLGTALANYRDFYFSRNGLIGGTLGVTGNGGFLSTLSAVGAVTLSSTLGVAGAANFSSTVTASSFIGSGASLTGIPETAITDGSILARVGANETITGTWVFPTTLRMSGVSNSLTFTETDAGSNLKNWGIVIDGASWQIRNYDDAFSGYTVPFEITKSSNAVGMAATLTVAGNIGGGGIISAGSYFQASSTLPFLYLYDTDSTAGARMGAIYSNADAFHITIGDDAGSIAAETIVISRSGSTPTLVTVYTPMTVNGALVGGSTISTTSTGTFTAGLTTSGTLSANAGSFTSSVTANTLVSTGGQFELGRGTAQGSFIDNGTSAGLFTTNSGAWTVDAGDVVVNYYSLVGNTMTWMLTVMNTTTPGTNQEFRITIPGGKTAQIKTVIPGLIGYTSGDDWVPNTVCEAQTGVTYVRCYFYNNATFSATTNDTNVSFQIILMVN